MDSKRVFGWRYSIGIAATPQEARILQVGVHMTAVAKDVLIHVPVSFLRALRVISCCCQTRKLNVRPAIHAQCLAMPWYVIRYRLRLKFFNYESNQVSRSQSTI